MKKLYRGPYARKPLSPKSPFPNGARGLLWGEHIGTRKRAYRSQIETRGLHVSIWER